KRPKVVDPNAPRRPANAFMLFCDMQRDKLKEERKELQKSMPGSEQEVALSNITKALGQRWRSLSDVERKMYQDLFKEQVKQYDRELSDY
ncbi:high mobility group box domain-containing protein, partial [Entophlyctis helioformis]